MGLKRKIFSALKDNIIPGLFLWCIGIALVASYYLNESSRSLFLGIIQLKEEYGFLYSAISTSLFGGLIPFVFMRLSGRDQVGNSLLHGVVFVAYWALRGVDVDTFYRLQGWIFGNGVDWQTIFFKVCVDQFIYCVFWATPVTAGFYSLKEADFSFEKWKKEKKGSDLVEMIIVFTVSTWLVWIPGTAIIYSLPAPLQIPLFNLTLCFFVILVSVFSKKEKTA